MGCSHYSMILERDGYFIQVSFESSGSGYNFQFSTALNEPGLLYRVTAALFVHGFEITSARIITGENQAVFDEFMLKDLLEERASRQSGSEIRGLLNPVRIRSFLHDTADLLYQGKSALQFIEENDIKIPRFHEGSGSADLLEMDGYPVIEVRGSYQKTLLLSLFQAFYSMDVNVHEAEIRVLPDGRLSSRFMIASDDSRFTNPQFQEQLMEELRTIVQDLRYKMMKI